jgi:hypothetical protein
MGVGSGRSRNEKKTGRSRDRKDFGLGGVETGRGCYRKYSMWDRKELQGQGGVGTGRNCRDREELKQKENGDRSELGKKGVGTGRMLCRLEGVGTGRSRGQEENGDRGELGKKGIGTGRMLCRLEGVGTGRSRGQEGVVTKRKWRQE